MIRRARVLRPSGVTVYRGPSLQNPDINIAVVLTGLPGHRSRNAKTGAMVQAWILVDGETFVDSLTNGHDSAICGSCPARGIFISKRTPQRAPNGQFLPAVVTTRRAFRWCYVSSKAPQSITKKLRARGYPQLSLPAAAELLRGESVRLGAYGDPAMVPVTVWSQLLQFASGWTGYTHQWGFDYCSPDMRRYVMASCETAHQASLAQSRGWRTFRVKQPGQPVAPLEIICPASAEAGNRLDCNSCRACNGGKGQLPNPERRSVVIDAHGTKSTLSGFMRLQTAN
jgi:hypothetical protein